MGKWRTAAGEVLEIRDMGTNHLRNAVRMLDRVLDNLDQGLIAAASFDVDTMASHYAGQESDAELVVAAYWSAKKRELEEELRRRP